MDDRKYVFVGNRECVLQKMLDMQLDIKAVYVMENSFLQRWLDKRHIIDYTVISAHFASILADFLDVGFFFDFIIKYLVAVLRYPYYCGTLYHILHALHSGNPYSSPQI